MRTFRDTRPYRGQDPHVTLYEGNLLLIQSDDEERITIRKLRSLDNPLEDTESHVVWDHPNERQVWAPELHRTENGWQIFYSFSDGQNHSHRTHVLTSLSDNPFGPYERQRVGPDIWGIDMTTFLHHGHRYYVWSGWERNGDEFPQHLYISLIPSIFTRVRISSPTLPWEGEINEGPQWTGSGLLFSANASWTTDYATGFLRLTGSDPLQPDSWSKDPLPLATNVGHAQALDDTLIYHRKLSSLPGWTDREIATMPLETLF